MSVRTRNISDYFAKIDHALDIAHKSRNFDCGLSIAKEVIGLLGIESVSADIKSFPRLKTNSSWTKNAPDYEDRKASYVLAEDNNHNIDFKLFWVNRPAKRVISNLAALTPNFEDEPFYSNKNIGIDFVLSENGDHLIIVLSNNYKIRVLEIHKKLSNTQKKIFEKWMQDFDFSNKAQVHKLLWDSFDIQPLNKEFYIQISGLFNDLVQHLEKKNILNKKQRPQFVNRLIGRIIFCWFLRKKEIVSEEAGYFDAQGCSATEYYHTKLEALFFKVLNTSIEERAIGVENKTPFLNGGLFEPKENDLVGRDELSFPEDYFERFYKFLGHYNFTTDESTSDFQQVAIDPEMLGRIFENLLAEETADTGEQARKAKGTFYTPREIVDYMCRESLRAYLSESMGDDVRKGEVLQLLFDKKEHEFDLKGLSFHKNKIIDALDNIKAIDPACGSGAFPMGMLQIMLSLYERLDSRLDHYKTKLGIIKNNIFGVDIEPMAVEISRLRTWLSLVVDSTIKPSEKNLGISELPNLDFKFVCANTLIPLEENGELFDNNDMAEQMQSIRSRYFETKSSRIKEKMKKDFEILIKRNQSLFVSNKQKQLLTYHPFDSDNVTDFFNSQFMFGINDFDVVIGNPPYKGFRDLDKQIKEELQKIYFSAEGKFDLYIPFIERAFGILKKNGVLIYICPTGFTKRDHAQNIREFLLKNSIIKEIVDFGHEQMFDQATNYTGIFHFNKIAVKESLFKYRVGLSADFMEMKQQDLSNHSWVFVDDRSRAIIEKINQNPRLEDIAKISEGIVTGLNDLYLKKNSEIKSEGYEKEYFRPCYRGKEIERYSLKLNAQSVFYPYFLKDGKTIVVNEAQLKQEAPKYLSYLRNNIDLIKGRGYFIKSRKQWYELWNQRDLSNFMTDKIITPELSERNSFSLSHEGQFYGDTVCGIILKDSHKKDLDLHYVLAILNSKLIEWFYKKTTVPKAGGFFIYKVMYLEKIPLKIISHANQKPFIEAVGEILKSKAKEKTTVDIESKVDEMVMDLYGLSKEEQKVVLEGS